MPKNTYRPRSSLSPEELAAERERARGAMHRYHAKKAEIFLALPPDIQRAAAQQEAEARIASNAKWQTRKKQLLGNSTNIHMRTWNSMDAIDRAIATRVYEHGGEVRGLFCLDMWKTSTPAQKVQIIRTSYGIDVCDIMSQYGITTNESDIVQPPATQGWETQMNQLLTAQHQRNVDFLNETPSEPPATQGWDIEDVE